RPGEGAAMILVALSRIATTACDWLEGGLRGGVNEGFDATGIEGSEELGGGVRELLFPRLLVGVPFDELVRAVKLAPQLIAPLNYRVKGQQMTLRRSAEASVAPPAF